MRPENAKKHPHGANFSAPSENAKKHPHISYHAATRGGVVVMDGNGGEKAQTLREKLIVAGQSPWTTPTRLSCISLILSHIESALRKSKDIKARGIPFSNRMAHQFCSKLRTAPQGVAREPLAALVKAGLIEQSSPAKVNSFAKHSARYRLTPEGRRIQAILKTSPLAKGAQRKRDTAPERLAAGLNRRWPFRAQLLRDLASVTLAPLQVAQETATELLKDKGARASTKAVLHVLSTREHTARVQPCGQITTSLSSCPRKLKPHLCIDGEPAVLCDISSAHWMFLPRLASNRIDYCRQRGDDEGTLAPLKGELERLIELCSSGSFYESTLPGTATAADIKSRKKLMNILLNSPRSKSEINCVWRSLRRQFPLCVSMIDSIKRDDHRNISRQLQHFTAAAINAALIEMQAEGLPAIPDVDCLIVRRTDHAAACAAIGRAMFTETRGVRVKVGGIHYSPEIRSHDPKHAAALASNVAQLATKCTRPKCEQLCTNCTIKRTPSQTTREVRTTSPAPLTLATVETSPQRTHGGEGGRIWEHPAALAENVYNCRQTAASVTTNCWQTRTYRKCCPMGNKLHSLKMSPNGRQIALAQNVYHGGQTALAQNVANWPQTALVQNVADRPQNALVQNVANWPQNALVQNVANWPQNALASERQARPLTKDETSPKGAQSVDNEMVRPPVRNLLELLEQWVLLSACIFM